MKLEFNQLKFDTENFEREKPYFLKHRPDLEIPFDDSQYENLVVIGNGGSVTSLRALYYAFSGEADKELEIITTMEPGYLRRVHRHLEKEDTLVMPISKSGNTTGVIESTLFFQNKGYDIIPLTSEGGLLSKIAERKDWNYFKHPDIGGRFTGLSETALIPAKILGLDSEHIFRSGREAQEEFWKSSSKPAKLASGLKEAEDRGYEEVLTPFYSTRLFGFYPLTVQLMHESVCKEGNGQTFYGDLGPEYQHHTNQRLFGGKDNVVPLFFDTGHEKLTLDVDEGLEGLDLRGKNLGLLDGKDLGSSLKAESRGVKDALQEESRPFIEVKLEKVNYESISRFMAFMQLTAVYSAWIRDVNAFNQPDVEKSKQQGFEKRFDNS
jgi:glucose-6-phosphate isomerase